MHWNRGICPRKVRPRVRAVIDNPLDVLNRRTGIELNLLLLIASLPIKPRAERLIPVDGDVFDLRRNLGDVRTVFHSLRAPCFNVVQSPIDAEWKSATARLAHSLNPL